MVLQVTLADITGGKGGYVRLNVTSEGDYRLLSTTDVDYLLYHLNGTEVEAEMVNGAITWYPQFASSLFLELEEGTYLLWFAPGPLTEAEIVIVKAAGHEGEGHEHGSNDPHFWLDPISAKVQVEEISEALQRADPANATYYEQNARDLSSRLDQLHYDFQEGLRNRTKDAIVSTHEGFNYLAFRYGFEAHGAIGISADQQPSPQDLADLVGLMEGLDLHYVFSEPVYSDAVMETIASETGAGILVLDGLHGRTGIHSDLDYFEIMYANLESLKMGLEVTS
jgi:zinc transport system substrate-binding protein